MLLDRLLDLLEEKQLIMPEDRAYTQNLFLDCLKQDAPMEGTFQGADIAACLAELAQWAADHQVIPDTNDEKDRFSARLAGCFTPHPAQVRKTFYSLLNQDCPQAATDWFYQLCRDIDYIRVARIAQNIKYPAKAPCGELEITINLSKPEKDPRDIAAAKNAPQAGYPACMLCRENPGYAGRVNFPARQNHRIIPMNLANEEWYIQYSPYLYYDEHCIVLSGKHEPMHLTRKSFDRLFDFVDRFPHYFLGANADLPIVGGSILTHDHYQGGNYVFPMDKAAVRCEIAGPANACLVNWPMTCLRFTSESRQELTDIAMQVLTAWREYSDPSCDIYAHTDAPHNTVTPVVRKLPDGQYRLHLVLRNNRTSQEHPLGIFHPHAQLHHIKKENIGLIEVMGLFILPGRLKTELADLSLYLQGKAEIPVNSAHESWVKDIAARTGSSLSADDADAALREAVADTCYQVLCDAGVYKQDEKGLAGLDRFLKTIGMEIKN
ncbi:MAG: UDP-glucose--hexose-1-phosphate uridylyltransferase [Clostridiales bacterium]|nr:UDP-glucose--hexose-1-phosphate uridylyltransferase [Clostridiales bacterium]